MYLPELVIEVSDTETVAVLRTPKRSQRKIFPAGWKGAHLLLTWMRDLGIKDGSVRISIAEGTRVGSAAPIVVQLGTEAPVTERLTPYR